MTDRPKVNVNASDGNATIEVEDDDAIDVAKEIIGSIASAVGDVSRVYVELGSPQTATGDAEALFDASDHVEDVGFDGKEIGEGTATHLVAHVLKRNGSMTVGELTDEIDEYPEGTVSSALTNGKNGHLFKREESDGGPGLWSLTDWGYEEMNRVDWYPADGGDE